MYNSLSHFLIFGSSLSLSSQICSIHIFSLIVLVPQHYQFDPFNFFVVVVSPTVLAILIFVTRLPVSVLFPSLHRFLCSLLMYSPNFWLFNLTFCSFRLRNQFLVDRRSLSFLVVVSHTFASYVSTVSNTLVHSCFSVSLLIFLLHRTELNIYSYFLLLFILSILHCWYQSFYCCYWVFHNWCHTFIPSCSKIIFSLSSFPINRLSGLLVFTI